VSGIRYSFSTMAQEEILSHLLLPIPLAAVAPVYAIHCLLNSLLLCYCTVYSLNVLKRPSFCCAVELAESTLTNIAHTLCVCVERLIT
jgi:hypothetical protein